MGIQAGWIRVIHRSSSSKLTTLRDKLIKTGMRIVRHARYVTFQMAEVAVPSTLFEQILSCISRLASSCNTG